MTSIPYLFRAGVAAIALAVAIPHGAPALAQNSSVQELLNRVDRLQRELSTLQRQVYRGEAPPSPAAAAPAGAAVSAGAGAAASDPRVGARNSVRITQLENEIRSLTGKAEETDFRLRQIQERLERLVADVDQRLTALEGGRAPGTGAAALTQPAPTLVPPPGVIANGATASGAPVLTPPSARAPVLTPPAAATAGAPPRTLGTIPRDQAVSAPRGAVPPAAAAAAATVATAGPLPEGTDKQQYEYALSLMLQKQDFAEAETALKAFVDTHPTSSLAGNAQYWLGETHYVRKNYQDAAFAFAEGYQKHPKSAKAPDSLLKLGMSLAQLDKKREACTAYARLLSNFPTANARLKARVERERNRSNCQ